MKYIYLFFILISSLLLSGCATAPIPEVQHQEQRISSIRTSQLNQIERLKIDLDNSNTNTMYIYIDKDGSKNLSGRGVGELPHRMRRLLTSILVDFGSKVKVIDSSSVAQSYLIHPNYQNDVYILDGAITMYDKDIMSQSSGFDFGIDFGGGSGEGSGNNDFKDKDKLSILGMDFYLRQNGFIKYKTSSQIDIKSTSKGYSFGISINNGGIGMSAYKSIKDGVGLSVRKLLQSSMHDLIYQVSHKNKR